jgi:DNA-binding NtrC family response regulator
MPDPSEAPEKKPKVLFLDDEREIREIGSRVLDRDFDVFTAATVEEAEKLIFLQEDLHVLICDHHMPGEDGLDFCMRLHRRRNPMIRILISGFFNPELALRAVNDQTLFYCLPKPFRIETLIETVRKADHEFNLRLEAHERRKYLEALERTPQSGCERFREHFRVAVGVGGLVLSTFLIILVIVFLLGLLVLLLLYFIKSALGIDVFADRHLSDFIEFRKAPGS